MLALGAALSLAGCADPARVEAPPQPTTVTGRVVHADDPNRGVPGVIVRAVNKTSLTTTDSTGWFNLEVSVANGEFLQLTLSKTGFDEAAVSLTVQSGRSNPLPAAVTLARSGTGGGGGTSGPASNVVLKSSSTSSIGVRRSGSNETALLTFEVRDAQGRPVDFGHRAKLQFSLSQLPGGGAFLSPDTVSTDSSGVASVALNSGTLAQAVQVRAQVVGLNVFSDPVRVAIHGGPPNAEHFSFAVAKLNVPGLVEFGIIDPVTAFVGDFYGNPVPTGTVVYFATKGGIIQGSATTDDHGRATVDLITAEPVPNPTPAFSDSAGIARVSIQAVNENQIPIIRSNLAVLFSGHTELTVSPQTFAIPLNGAQDFTVTLWDREHHNPLSEGTTITFAVTIGTVGGETSIVLPDTFDKRFTSFSFRIENPEAGALVAGPNREWLRLRSDTAPQQVPGAALAAKGLPGAEGAPQVAAFKPATVTVSVTSANGNASANIHGTVEQPDPAP